VGVRALADVAAERREPAEPRLRAVLAAAESSASVEAIARDTRQSAAETRAALGRLEAEGYLVRRDLGGWEPAAR
jgi:DNA-binding IclR family transcriptional regulator